MLNVAVLGLWHLGSVTAACTADAGHRVTAYDPSGSVISDLQNSRPPVAEPGLAELVRSNVDAGRLRFTSDLSDAVSTADVVWICFDTPVNDDDEADVDFVINHAAASFASLPHDAVVLTSSQLPVGTVKRLEELWAPVSGGRRVSFACSPENLRLGKAISVFKEPDRVVIGVRDEPARTRLTELFTPITSKVEWMTVESAEMTKHAINAFLATSVSFINELATLCEVTGADAKQVERGLKTEKRIGPYAYLGPGGAVAGGTLARDLKFLLAIGEGTGLSTHLFDGVVSSNTSHRLWARRRLTAELGSVSGRTLAVWGLTYKPGTDTLRRSESVELCKWLVSEGAQVRAHDPAAQSLPAELAAVQRVDDPIEALRGASALVIATEWPEYSRADFSAIDTAVPAGFLVLDANRFLARALEQHTRCRVLAVGQPSV